MTAILLGNNRATRDASVPAPSLKDNGDTYNWRMFFDGQGQIADTDEILDLMDLLIDGYSSMNADRRFYARLQYMQTVQYRKRVEILANLTPEQFDGLNTEERALLERNEPFDPPGTWGEDELGMWESEVPLVLIDVFYAPYTPEPRPMSSHGDYENVPNIIWLRIANDMQFLETLNQLEEISFGRPRAQMHVPVALRD
jgi:hypothetical protein